MGTEKRQRQKANRQQRIIQEARAERVGTIKRSVLRWGIGAVAALGAIVLIAWIGGAFSDDDETATDTPTESVGGTPPADPTTSKPSATDTPAEYVGGTTPADPATGKPSAKLPTEPPTGLVMTDITVGTGAEAKNGDTVLVNYVGVRSVDGVEFDNNYGSEEPFPVVLGSGGVIQGWELGLIGVQAGGRRQLDIPADLAYGDADRGTIRPGDALTFVIDVVSVTPGDGS